jgi:hypothetical protein
MQFIIDGDTYNLDRETVTGKLRGRPPQSIQTHWVEVEGIRFPVKQALEISLGLGREAFTSHRARGIFDRLQFVTSTPAGTVSHKAVPASEPPVTSPEQAADAFGLLVKFLRSSPFTRSINQLEHDLENANRSTVAEVTSAAGLSDELLSAALIVRRDVGRVSDVIHATVISLALPLILEDGEFLDSRPSLGPGNDPSRPFDLQTNKRVAEFKVAVWSGGDMMRKRGLTADLVHLAMDDSGKRAELWAVGEGPLDFIRTCKSATNSLLARASRHQRERFDNTYGDDANLPLGKFYEKHASEVKLCNLATVLPSVTSSLI